MASQNHSLGQSDVRWRGKGGAGGADGMATGNGPVTCEIPEAPGIELESECGASELLCELLCELPGW